MAKTTETTNDVVAEAKAYCERVRTDAKEAGECASSYELSLIGSLYAEIERLRAEKQEIEDRALTMEKGRVDIPSWAIGMDCARFIRTGSWD